MNAYYDLDLIFGGLYDDVSDGSGDEDFLNTTPATHQNDNCLQSQKNASNVAALEHEVGYLSNLWSNPSR